MRKINLFTFCALLVISNLFAVNALAQAPQQISGGVVNGKALKLAKPVYPPAAKAVRASGAVNVQVLIDEEGNVVSATAVSGHPLLRAASEQAARESKFAPTKLQGVPVKVSGIVVYNFVPAETPLSWVQIGYQLAKAEVTKDFGENFPISSISASIPQEWLEEKAKAKTLWQKQSYNNIMKRVEESQKAAPQPPAKTENVAPKVGTFTPVGRDTAMVGEKLENLNIDEAETVRELIQLLKTRFLSDESRSWYFNLGTLLGKTDATMNNQNELILNISNLRQHQSIAPTGISSGLLTELQNFIALGEKGSLNESEYDQMRKMLSRLSMANF
jgi:TonB family protein